jgi:hypothetical protein
VSDPKLYRVTAKDYGSGVHRLLGLLAYSLSAGISFCVSVFLIYRLLLWIHAPERNLFSLTLELASLLLGALVFLITRGTYLWDFEIMPDYVVCYARGGSRRFERTRDRVLPETSRFTWFGRTRGLYIGDLKRGFAFVPATNPAYAEVRAKLANWPAS